MATPETHSNGQFRRLLFALPLPGVFLAAMLLLTVPPAQAEQNIFASAQDAFESGNYQSANDQLETLLQQEPDNVDAHFLQGVVLAEMGQTERAIEIFSNLTQRAPELSEPYNNLAVLYTKKGVLDKARVALLKAIELEPGYHTAYENLGDVYTKLAAKAYLQTYTLKEGNQRARNKYTGLLKLLGRENMAPSASAPAPAPQTSPPPTETAATDAIAVNCLALGPMDRAARDRAAGKLREQGNISNPIFRESRLQSMTQVYIDNMDQARELRKKLHRQGIKDTSIIAQGELKDMLSLGVYREDKTVNWRLKQLKALGYSAKTGKHHGSTGVYWLIHNRNDFDSLAFRKIFAGMTPRPVDCNWQPTGTGS